MSQTITNEYTYIYIYMCVCVCVYVCVCVRVCEREREREWVGETESVIFISNVSAAVSSGLDQVSPVYLGIEMIQPGKVKLSTWFPRLNHF